MIVPLPTYQEESIELIEEKGEIDHNYIRECMNLPSWKCACGLTNHGLNKRCADWRCRRERER